MGTMDKSDAPAHVSWTVPVTSAYLVRTLMLWSALVMVCAVLTACAPAGERQGADDPGEVTIEFWHYLAGPQGEAVDDLLRRFEQENSGIKVRDVFQGNPGALKQKLDGSFAAGAGNSPTVSLVYENWTDDFLARGYMDPVANYFDGPDGLSAEDLADFITVFREGNSWDGRFVTLPFNKSIYLLHLNMDILKEAGYTTAPQTQDQLAEFVRAATRKTGNRTTTYGMGVQPKGEALTTLMLAAGGRFLDDDGRPVLNSEEAVAALSFLKALHHPDRALYVNTDYMSMPFSSNLIASFIYSSASLPYNERGSDGKFEYRTAPVPGIDGKEPSYLIQGTNIGLFAAKSTAERAAGWRLIRFLTRPENAAYFCARSGYMPYRYSMVSQPELRAYMDANSNYALGARLVLNDRGTQEPKHRGWEGIRLEYDRVVDQTLSRADSDPRALLDAMQAQALARMN